MKKTKYVIIRSGSNSANQNRCNEAVVAVIVAENRAKAITEALAGLTVYPNQRLHAVPWSRASAAAKAEAEAEELSTTITAFCPVCGRESEQEAWKGDMIENCPCWKRP